MAKKLPQSVSRRNAGNAQIAIYHDSTFFAAAEGQKVPVAQRFLLLKMVSVFWCRFLLNCNMLIDCRISQIRTFPTGMTPSGLPFPFFSFPKIQNFFVFFDYPSLDPRKQKTEGCPTAIRRGNIRRNIGMGKGACGRWLQAGESLPQPDRQSNP